MKKLEFKIPDWRIGQTIFNFLGWIKWEKGYDIADDERMADPFHIPDDEFIKLWAEFQSLHDQEQPECNHGNMGCGHQVVGCKFFVPQPKKVVIEKIIEYIGVCPPQVYVLANKINEIIDHLNAKE